MTSTAGANRIELNLLLDKDDKSNSSRRPTNSLMTVHEQETTNDPFSDDSLHLHLTTDSPDQQQRTNDEKIVVSFE